MLSNLLLKRFDEILAARGITAIRYADDIAIFADSRSECESALEIVKTNLAKLSLSVPDLLDNGKTTILGPSEVAEFLGVEIRRKGDVYRLYAPSGKLEKIEAAMTSMVQIEKCFEQKRNIGQVVRSLESFIIGHGASMAVLNDNGDFMARLEAAKNRQLRTLLVNLLGEDVVGGLDHERLAILGIEPF